MVTIVYTIVIPAVTRLITATFSGRARVSQPGLIRKSISSISSLTNLTTLSFHLNFQMPNSFRLSDFQGYVS